jgi:Ca2+/H+ antiporter, TMEM165/GDT1 family
LLTAFGTFWLGEGIGAAWPGADWSLLALVGGYLIIALLCVRLAKSIARRAVSLRRI